MRSGRSRPDAVPEISATDLARLVGSAEEPFILDVRQPEEVADWAIAGAVNIPLPELPARVHELPREHPIVVVCASGSRSSQATSFLGASGYRAANLTGGMAAWGRAYDTASWTLTGGDLVQVRRRGKGCLSYVLGAGSEAFVVDPSVEVGLYEELAKTRGWRITRVFDTHLHADHVSGARDLAARTGASLHLSPFDSFKFGYEPLEEGERFALPGGLELSVAVLHTPGHTEGSVVFRIGDEAVLTGDTIFVDGVGRPDLAERAEEFARNLHRSLQSKVLVLPDEAVVFPAHYGDSTTVVPEQLVSASLGALRVSLPPLSLDENQFVAWATDRVMDRPPNYVKIIQANMGRSPAHPGELALLEAGPNRCSA